MRKLSSVLLITVCAITASCNKDPFKVTETSIVTASIDGQSYESNKITVKKIL